MLSMESSSKNAVQSLLSQLIVNYLFDMPLIITLPGKLPNFLQNSSSECHPISIDAIDDEQKLAGS